jgi:hypothetical protein
VSIEDAEERRTAIGGDYGVGYGGTKYPDLVANMRVDQGWGSAQLMGALHQVWPGYNSGGPTASSKVGFAAGAGVVVNLPFGVSTQMNLTGTYAQGATDYASSDISGFYSPRGFLVEATDATYNPATQDIETAQAWSVSGGMGTQVLQRRPAGRRHLLAGQHLGVRDGCGRRISLRRPERGDGAVGQCLRRLFPRSAHVLAISMTGRRRPVII